VSFLLGFAVALGALAAAPLPAAAAGASYYVSASEGDDDNPGTESSPWKSLAKLSAMAFSSGDTIYLKRGDVFEGTVTLYGAGSAAEPITLTAYGSGERPYIRGPGDPARRSSCVTLAAESRGWRLIGLEIGEGFNGIFIWIDGSGGNDFYHIEDCYIHSNVNAPATLPFGHAVTIKGAAPGVNTASNITIKNCIFKDNDRDFFPDNLEYGIFLTDVRIDGCTFTDGGYNSIYHTCATNFSITDSLWLHNGGGSIPVGNACIISGELTGGPDTNMVAGNEFGFTRDPGGADGCAYDFEIDTDGISFVNNFVHNGYGQAIMIMPEAVCNDIRIEDNIFYHNLSGTERHKGELALYGGGTGLVKNNIFQTRLRFTHFTKAIEGDARGLSIHGNRIKNIACLLLDTPVCTFDPVTNTAALAGPAGAALRYTTDGSVPTQASALYRGEGIIIEQTTVINCKAFRKGRLPSITCSRVLTPGGEAPKAQPPAKPKFYDHALQGLKDLVDRAQLCIYTMSHG